MALGSDDVFGSPKAGDLVAEDETVVELLAREQADLMKELMGDKMYPRAIGSKQVPEAQLSREYELMLTDPDLATDFFVGQQMSVEQMVNWAKEQEKKRGNVRGA